jgi:hypothetical protein
MFGENVCVLGPNAGGDEREHHISVAKGGAQYKQPPDNFTGWQDTDPLGQCGVNRGKNLKNMPSGVNAVVVFGGRKVVLARAAKGIANVNKRGVGRARGRYPRVLTDGYRRPEDGLNDKIHGLGP